MATPETEEERLRRQRRERMNAEMSHVPPPKVSPEATLRNAQAAELVQNLGALGQASTAIDAVNRTAPAEGQPNAMHLEQTRAKVLTGTMTDMGRAVSNWADLSRRQAAAPAAPAAPAAAAPAPAPAAPAAAPPGGATTPAADPQNEYGPPRPAATVANVGAMPQPQMVQSEPADLGQPPEAEDPFQYADRVKPMIDEALARGRTDIAARIQSEFTQLSRDHFAALNARYETDILPRAKQIQAELLKQKGKMLPAQFAQEARAVAMQAAEQREQMMAYMYSALRDPVLSQEAIAMFNDSPFIEPGVKVREFKVDPQARILYGIGEDGQPVNLMNGQPFAVPLDAAEALREKWYGSKKGQEPYTLKAGERRYDANNRLVAEGGADPEGSGRGGAAFSRNLDDARKAVDSRFGRDTSTGIMLNDSPQAREQYEAVMKRAEAYVSQQMNPVEAAARAYADVMGGGAASGGEYTGPRPWASGT